MGNSGRGQGLRLRASPDKSAKGAGQHQDGLEPTGKVKMLAVCYYMASSILVQSSNKVLFTVWEFNFPVLLALLQMLFISPVCFLVARPTLSLETAITVLPLAMVNTCNVLSGLIGTGGLSVPMFIALRRFTLMTTIILEWALYRKLQDRRTSVQVLVMLAGALVAAVSDLTFNAYGYGAVLLNNCFTSLYLILTKNIQHGLTTTGLIFYNSTLSLALLVLIIGLTGDVQKAFQYSELASPSFLVVLTSSCVLGLSINHSTFLCTQVNEPLTTSVAGSLKNIFMTILGMVAFGDYHFQPWNMLGILISLVGSCYYAYDKVVASFGRHSSSTQQATASGAQQRLSSPADGNRTDGDKV